MSDTSNGCQNFQYKLINAINQMNNALGWSQFYTAEMTEIDANEEMATYNYWTGILETDTDKANADVKDSGTLNVDMMQYQTDSATAQCQENQADSFVKARQQDLSTIGNNQSKWAQLGDVCCSISKDMASIISQPL